jgi:hypothetical protein
MSVAIKASKAPKVLLMPFTTQDMVKDVQDLCHKKGLKDRVKAVANLFVHGESFTDSIAGICSFLYVVKLAGERIVKWIPIFYYVSYVAGLVSTAQSIDSSIECKKLVSSYTGLLGKIKDKSLEEKALELSNALSDVEKNISSLRKKLSLGKYVYQNKCGRETLEQRIHSLGEKLRLRSPELTKNVADAEKFISLLASRAKLDLGYKLAELVNGVGTTAGYTFLMIITPPTILAGCCILATTSVGSLLLWGTRLFCVNKHPFDSRGRSHVQAVVRRAEKSVRAMRIRLATILISLKKNICTRPQNLEAIKVHA